MGKIKKVILLLLFLGLLLLLIGFSIWHFSLPRLEKSRVNEWLKPIGLELKAEEWISSSFGRRLTLKKALLISPDILEYPIISAQEIEFSAGLTSMKLTLPKFTYVTSKRIPPQWTQLFQKLLHRKVKLRIDRGAIEIWKKKAYTGRPFSITRIQFNGKMNTLSKGSFSLAVPGGFTSLTEFARSARFFPETTYLISADFETDFSVGSLSSLQVNSDEGMIFEAENLKWKSSPSIEIAMHKPHFKLELTHANRWRINGFIYHSLSLLWMELADGASLPNLKFQLNEGELLFADKWIFPLFSDSLEKVSMQLESTSTGWLGSLSGKIKRGKGTIAVKGVFNSPEGWDQIEAKFNDFPIDSFYPYYYIQFPYEKIDGTFSGTLANNRLNLKLKNFSATYKDEDSLQELTGLPTPLLLALLQNQMGEIVFSLPFKRDWEKVFAENILRQIKTRLRGLAEIQIRNGKVTSIDWIPIYFDFGQTALSGEEKSKLNRVAQWVTFLPNGVLEFQPNLPAKTPSSHRLPQWQVRKDKKGYRYLVKATATSFKAPKRSPEELVDSRLKTIVKHLKQITEISTDRIAIRPSSEQIQDSISYQLLLPGQK